MDPAFGVMSPFRNEAKALEGLLDSTIEAITATQEFDAANTPLPLPSQDPAPAAPTGIPCSLCGAPSTAARIPKDGLYLCQQCVAQQQESSRARVFPIGTFKCCPSNQGEKMGGVVRCTACKGWYHLACVGINGGVLRDHVTLSTVAWYCPEPGCCEKVLKNQLKKSADRK